MDKEDVVDIYNRILLLLFSHSDVGQLLLAAALRAWGPPGFCPWPRRWGGSSRLRYGVPCHSRLRYGEPVAAACTMAGAAAESTRLRWRRNGQKELPRIQGWGDSWEEIPSVRGQGRRPGGATHAGGQGQQREELPKAVAVRVHEGLEELSHVEGQEGRRWGDTPRPR